jgi:hypothetical protein
VFSDATGTWKQAAELKGSDTAAKDQFGYSVAISGTTAIVGALGHASSAGRGYVFSDVTGTWKQAAELKGSDTVGHDEFGNAVAISGTTAIVGARGHASSAGRGYVFSDGTGTWKQVAELGTDSTAGAGFGSSVAISGGSAVVGASFGMGAGAERAYLFENAAAGWKQAAELKDPEPRAGDDFGRSVTISGTTAIVGAPDAGTGGIGQAYVFEA